MVDKDQEIVILSEIDHVLKRSSMYLGSNEIHKQYFWVPFLDNTIKKIELEYIPGLYKIICEVIDNAIDEVCSRGFGDKINIEYNLDEGTFKVIDNGRGIPLDKHKDTDKYMPELVYAQLRAGSNFDDSNRITAGMNGVGATLTTIFSEFLQVTVKRDGKIYDQTFKNNLSKIGEPRLEKDKNQKFSGTRVFFKPDYSIFSKKLPIELLHKRCLELSVAYPKLEIVLNIIEKKCTDLMESNTETIYKNKKFEDFIQMFGMKYTIYEDSKLQLKLAICHNTQTDSFEHFSNINGIDTFRGGNHVDSLKEIFSDDIKEKIYKEYKIETTINDISKNIIVIVFQVWNAPQFEGQTKEKFVSDKNIIKKFYLDNISSRRITSMVSDLPELKQAIVDDITLKNEKKSLVELRKAQKDIKSKKVAKLIECSSKDRKSCTIFLTEGDSAVAGLSAIRDTKHHAGLPLRGKVLNVSGMTPKDIIENKEIQTIMAVIGLEFGKPPIKLVRGKAEIDGLRYGNISILTDADHDGSAIRCLLINFFFRFWPELFEHGFITISEAPLYEVIDKKSNNQEFFYDKVEFMKFLKGKNSSDYDISYFKGLGSCDKNGWDFFINKKPKMYKIEKDDLSKSKLSMAFGDDSILRKEWLRK